MADYDEEIDVTGYSCPVPIFKTHKALNHLNNGEILHVIASDPRSIDNMVTFTELNSSQFELLESKQENNLFSFLIKKL